MVRNQEDKLLMQLMLSSYGWKQKSVKERNVHEKPHKAILYTIAYAVLTWCVAVELLTCVNVLHVGAKERLCRASRP